MTNQRTLDMLHHSIYGDPDFEQYDISEDELSHHGVLGMSWGKRHGPPYPLGGVDKRVARAEAKRKREKERRLKKLQKAAKKARKLKKREEKEAADIQKKKQKLVKKGDMDAIKKNAKLFTNEELQYIVERDEAKRSILGKKERDEAQAMEDFSRKMAQVANIAASAGTIIGAVRQGAQMVNDFKGSKLKDLEIEDKRRASIQKEFEMRFGKDDHSPEAQRFIDRALAGEDYKAPKETKIEKAERKRDEDLRQRKVDEYWKDMKKLDELDKKAKKAEKKSTSKPITSYEGYTQTLSEGKSFVVDGNDKWSKKINEQMRKMEREVAKSGERAGGYWQSAYAKGSDSSARKETFDYDAMWGKAFKETINRTPEARQTYDAGKDWTSSFFSSNWSGKTYEARKGKTVSPKRMEPSSSGQWRTWGKSYRGR